MAAIGLVYCFKAQSALERGEREVASRHLASAGRVARIALCGAAASVACLVTLGAIVLAR